MTTVRIAGAQIPIMDEDIQYNKNEIFKALDWAKENNVDLIQTPEGSLSGYGDFWESKIDELLDTLSEVEEYQKKCGVALNLATSILDYEQYGAIKRNQIRHYDKEGRLYGKTNKTYLVHADGNSVASFHPLQSLNIPFAKLHGVGMICNDMWGAPQEQGFDNKPVKSLNQTLTDKHVDIIFHSTNGYKFAEEDHKINPSYGANGYIIGDKDYVVRETFDKWSEAWLQMTAFRSVASILTVDCCVHWGWDGSDKTLNKCRTSSPSGVVNPLGEWVAQAPRYGRQYFYYDLDINDKEKYWKIINDRTGGTFKSEDAIKIKK
tara:strand:+ start:545 stop:1504 length:960 start_codon:yes stop_codon:yes gene_type:complete